MIHVKILSIQYPERYAVRRIVHSALVDLQAEFPALEVEISELDDPLQIGKYASVLVLPTLVINEQVVSSGIIPGREEICTRLRQAALIDAKMGA